MKIIIRTKDLKSRSKYIYLDIYEDGNRKNEHNEWNVLKYREMITCNFPNFIYKSFYLCEWFQLSRPKM